MCPTCMYGTAWLATEEPCRLRERLGRRVRQWPSPRRPPAAVRPHRLPGRAGQEACRNRGASGVARAPVAAPCQGELPRQISGVVVSPRQQVGRRGAAVIGEPRQQGQRQQGEWRLGEHDGLAGQRDTHEVEPWWWCWRPCKAATHADQEGYAAACHVSRLAGLAAVRVWCWAFGACAGGGSARWRAPEG